MIEREFQSLWSDNTVTKVKEVNGVIRKTWKDGTWKIFAIQFRANIDSCLCCLFQRLFFRERREMLGTVRY